MKSSLISALLFLCVAFPAMAGGQPSAAQLSKDFKIPDGCTLYGQVSRDGNPMAGVVVSDGHIVTKTDRKGRYFLNSDKKEGSVFISLPSCTELECQGVLPAYWQRTDSGDKTAERHDFFLKSVDNTNHVIIALSDLHFANINDDIQQFTEVCMPRIREEVEKYRSKGIPVYCINAGDSSYDRYWYEYLYTIADFPSTLRSVDFPVPMFCAMGNHDNDGATPPDAADVDFEAAGKYRQTMGPTHYSFNLGNIHYVVLDDVVYRNSEGRIDSYDGIAGKRDYDTYFRDDVIEWLKKDLETVADKTAPLVAVFHNPVFAYNSGVMEKGIYSRMSRGNEDPDEMLRRFASVFREFPDVHFITGHTHKNLPCYGTDDPRFPEIANILDHNISSAGGSWWQTGAHRGLILAPDSAPAGFEVFTMQGKAMQWYFVSDDDGCAKQFRVFDMNCVRDYYRTNGEVRVMLAHQGNKRDYRQVEDNIVLVHVWAWATPWKISVTEDGKELPVKAVKAENPQYTISYYLPKSAWEDNGSSRWPRKYNVSFTSPHFFKVKASSPNSTIVVKVTDTFGNEWVERVSRPKAFSKTMR